MFLSFKSMAVLIGVALSVSGMSAWAAEGDKLKLSPLILTYEGDNQVAKPLTSLNTLASQHNMRNFPSRVTITDNNLWTLQSLSRQLQTLGTRANTEYEFAYIGDLVKFASQSQVCYKGTAKGAIDILLYAFEQVSASIGVYGAKANGEIVIPGEQEFFQSGTEHYESLWFGTARRRILSEFENYPASESTLFVLANYGQQGDGTELEVYRIPKCP